MSYVVYVCWTAIFGSLLNGNEGSSVQFTAEPNIVMYGFSKPLSLGCSLTDWELDDKDDKIELIFITRGPTRQKQTEKVAQITRFESATANTDLDVILVDGSLSNDTVDGEGYLNVEWDSPGEKQAAVYECKIKTKSGLKKATQIIRYVLPDIKQLIDKLSELEKFTLEKFEAAEKKNNYQLKENDKNLAAVKTTLEKMETEGKETNKKIEKAAFEKIDTVEKGVKKELLDKILVSEKSALQKIDAVEKGVKKELLDKISVSEKAALQKIDAIEKGVKKELFDKISVSEKAALQKIDTIEKGVKKELLDKIFVSEKASLQKIDTIEKGVKKELLDKILVSERSALQKIDGVEKNVNLRLPKLESSLETVLTRHMETGVVLCKLDDFNKISTPMKTLYRLVTFKVPYKSNPIVYAAISTLDSEHDRNLRVMVTATKVTKTSVTLEISTWSTTMMHEVRATWLSYDSI